MKFATCLGQSPLTPMERSGLVERAKDLVRAGEIYTSGDSKVRETEETILDYQAGGPSFQYFVVVPVFRFTDIFLEHIKVKLTTWLNETAMFAVYVMVPKKVDDSLAMPESVSSYYEWSRAYRLAHDDQYPVGHNRQGRKASINIMLNDVADTGFNFYDPAKIPSERVRWIRNKDFWLTEGLEPSLAVKYKLNEAWVLDSTKPHEVIHQNPAPRYTLALSLMNTTYEEFLEKRACK